ncbi:hypothetical protein MKW98_013259 [Papaver atlanticum]|uniref:Uncharacterized protein n=1 Tax=Papaver atlanticum TaxID=357466 RepID=A0AAD4SFD8_9MAGN|nr:hypothetical protein MKW98_013259 [Papaver atlanticum]
MEHQFNPFNIERHHISNNWANQDIWIFEVIRNVSSLKTIFQILSAGIKCSLYVSSLRYFRGPVGILAKCNNAPLKILVLQCRPE